MAGCGCDEADRDVRLTPVIIAGGKGARLWPLSHDGGPKPFLRIADDQSLLQLTLRRLASLGEIERPLIVCNARHEQAIREHAVAAGFAGLAMLLEPEGRNTAAAICAAALWSMKKHLANEPLLIMPADHIIVDESRFASTIMAAAELVTQQKIVTFGMKPDRPAAGYGYIELGASIDESRAQFRVERFVEKPDAVRAAEFLATGRHYWNSGMFLATPATLISEFALCRPDILAQVEKAFPAGDVGDRVHLDHAAFAQVEAIAFDRAVMERTASAATVLAEIGWSDVGDWQSMWEAAPKDDRGNALRGPVSTVDTANSLIRSEGPELLCIGLEDIVAVATSDAVLVAKREYAQKIGEFVERARRGPAQKALFTSSQYDLSQGETRMADDNHARLRVFVCVKGRGQIATGVKEHALEEGSAVVCGPGETCRIQANADGFLRVIEIRIDET